MARWPAPNPRVLVTDAWLANAGDALIAVALDGMLREIAPKAAILHAAYQWDDFGPRIPILSTVPPLEHLLGTPWMPPLPGYEQAGAQLVDEADAIVCQGGGFLIEAYSPRGRLAALADAVRRGKPVALLGVALGRFDEPAARRDLATVLGGAALVVVRDRGSLANALDAGAPDPLLGTDLALAAFSRVPSPDPERHGISVVLTDHHAQPARRTARAAIARDLLNAVLEIAPHDVLHLWSTVQGARVAAREDDAELAAALVAELPRATRARVTLDTAPMTPARATDLVRSHRAVVTMRMHPALIAAGSGIPWALVVADDRLHPFDGAGIGRRVARDADPEHAVAAIRQALTTDASSVDVYDELATMRERLVVTRDALAAFVQTAAPGGRPVPVRTRARHAAQRAITALSIAARGTAGALPRRAPGAVQGPMRTRPGHRTVWGWARARDDEIIAILVTEEGRPVASAQLGPPPPDVLAAFATSDDTLVGWSATVPFDQRREHRTIGAMAVSGNGAMLPLTPLSVAVDLDAVGEIGSPRSGDEVVAGAVYVNGTALPRAALAFVEIAVDGTPHGRARLFNHDDPACAHLTALSGFEHTLQLDPAQAGNTVVVTASAVTLDGAVHECGEVAIRVVGRASEPPDMVPLPSHLHAARASSPTDDGRRRGRRIGVFTHSLELGGAQLWLHEVVRHLHDRGDRCCIVSGSDGPLRAELEDAGVPVHVCDAVVGPPTASVGRELAEIVADVRVDVAVVNTVLASAAARALVELAIPMVWAVHEHIPPEQVWTFADSSTRERFMALLRASDRLLFVCRATRDLFSAATGTSETGVAIPYGISVAALDRYAVEHPAARDRFRTRLGVAPSDLVLVSVGTIEPRKAQAVLVHALAAAGDELSSAHVVLVGDAGSGYARSVARLAHQLGVGPRVHVVAATREPEPWLLAADAFVMASDLESMPRAAMEAMAFRLPLVLGDVGGCAELLGDGAAGRIVAPRDVGALVEAIRELASAPPTERAAIGDAARSAVVEHHGDLSYARRVAAQLDEVVAERAREHQPVSGSPVAR